MKCVKVRCIFLIFLLLALVACGNSQESARLKLGQMNVKYSEDSFVERVRDGDLLAVKLFLQSGMNPNASNKDGESALGVAARFGRGEVVQALLAQGADLNSRDHKYGATPLIWASVNGFTGIVKSLLEKGADANTPDSKNGMTPLMSAAAGGKAEVIKVLLDKGAAINATDQDNRTPLMWAANYGHLGAIKVLLEKGADLKVVDKKGGITALGITALNGKTGAAKLLVEKGAEVNFANKQGMTPLMLAAKNNRLDTVKLLLEHGAQVNAKDKEGKTALDLARDKNHKDVEQTLLKAGAIAGTSETPKQKKPQSEPASQQKTTEEKYLNRLISITSQPPRPGISSGLVLFRAGPGSVQSGRSLSHETFRRHFRLLQRIN